MLLYYNQFYGKQFKFFLLHNQELVLWVLITFLIAFDKQRNNSLFEKVGEFFYFENLICKVCRHLLIKPVWFSYMKNYFVTD